jgi:hypothetical protein
MPKRPKLKGRGADIYLDAARSGEQQLASGDTAEHSRPPKRTAQRRMVTTYLPVPLVERLQKEWLRRVQVDTKAQKAHIIAEALESYFRGLDVQTSKHLDGGTSKHSAALSVSS